MKKNWKNSLTSLLLLLLIFLGACSQDRHTHAEGELYTCPMHPQIVKEGPGTCPICNMDLVRQNAALTLDTLPLEMGYLLQPANQAVISGIKTVQAEIRNVEAAIDVPGRITYDTRRIHNIAARFGGRIEKLYVRYNYQRISKGQKLYDIYSPAIVTAQEELIYLVNNDPGNVTLLNAARQKLSLLGLTNKQIRSIENSKKALMSLPVYSPYSGYVIDDVPTGQVASAMPAGGSNQASGNAMAAGMGGAAAPVAMAQQSAATANTVNLQTREGMYVTAGQTVFRVVNTDVVWGIFSTYPENMAALKVGQSVTITVENNESRRIQASVDFIEPIYSPDANLSAFRVYLQNGEEQLKVGNLLKGTIKISREGLWLPVRAVLDLGERQIVFVKKGEVFEPVEVSTGIRTDEWIQVLDGLSRRSRVAVNAQFMIDSESFIKVPNS
jgi:Cu(I)/Ag(I) efflux system membrane fusion protein